MENTKKEWCITDFYSSAAADASPADRRRVEWGEALKHSNVLPVL